MQATPGLGHLDSLVDDIKRKESDRVKLESQLRQLRLRAEAEAADVSQLKSELETAQVERLALQKRIGLLSRKNEDLAGENAKLVEETCDFQRSMANNEAKLKENEEDFRRAQRGFVEDLEKANAAYASNRAVMNTLLGRKGVGCAAVPSPDELEGLKAAAAKAQEATLRAAEVEARLRGVEAESQALKTEAADTNQKRESLRMELASLQEKLKSVNMGQNGGQGKRSSAGDDAAASKKQQQQQQQQQRVSRLEQEVGNLEETCNRQATYINQLEDYANSVEAANAQLMEQNQQGGGGKGGGEGQSQGQFEDGAAPPPSHMGGNGSDEMQTTETDNERAMMEQENVQEVAHQGDRGRREMP